MATEKTDFLRFNAYSMKELITRKLSEDSNFTDQIYEGSNLAILIDLVAYMYQVLVYQLNNAASESMFSDTQVYENISRLVKLIGYNPHGCASSSFQMNFNLTSNQDQVLIPRYSRVSTGKTDRKGNEIYFSTAGENNTNINLGGNMFVQPEQDYTVNLYNGTWKLYNTVFTASGTENETFVLDGVQSDSANGKYVASDMLNVVVRRGEEWQTVQWKADANGLFLNYTNDSSIFNVNNTNIYSAQETIYSVRLNQDKTYELTFGNGIVGQKLQKGDLVYVFYLETNGPDGQVDINDIDWSAVRFEHAPHMFGVDEDTYRMLFDLPDEGSNTVLVTDRDVEYTLQPLQQNTSKFTPEQAPDDIRKDAPDWFKTGNRLITPSDYEYFIRNIVYVKDYIPNVRAVDVRCMNNTQYMSTFMKWLYLNGRNHHGDGRYYFKNQQFWNSFQYTLADPADANNTYIWLKSDSQGMVEDMYDTDSVESFMNEKLAPVKTMTTEIKVLKPVLVDFDICANPNLDEIRRTYLGNFSGSFDDGLESYIEITVDGNMMFVGNQVQNMVFDAITSHFETSRQRIGQVVDFNSLLSRIYRIDGISNVRTVYRSFLGGEYIAVNGLSFASWSPLLWPSGDEEGYDDLAVSTSSRTLEPFQFPVFVGADTLLRRIKVITKSQTQVNAVGQ